MGSTPFIISVTIFLLQFITIWFFANLSLPGWLVSLGGTTIYHTTSAHPAPTLPVGTIPKGTLPGTQAVLTHPSALSYAVYGIFLPNLTVMLVEALPGFGLAFGIYVAMKTGLVVNYESSRLALSSANLLITGALVTHAFFWLEILGFAIGSSIGTYALIDGFRHKLKVMTWTGLGLLLSALVLFVAAVLEASFILAYSTA